MALFDIVKPRICEMGKIKLGGKSAQVRTAAGGSQWRAPEKYDHFIVTTLHRDTKGDLVRDAALMTRLVEEGYADPDGKLRQLPVSVLSNDIEDIMQSSWLSYAGRRVAARSDGVTLVKFFSNGAWLDTPVEEPWKPEYADMKDKKGNPVFKMHTTFNCVITAKAARWGGVYKFRTTSIISAQQLAGTLLEIRNLSGGILRGMPLRLIMRPLQVSPGGKTTTVYVVHCEVVGDDILAIQGRAADLARMETENRQKLVTAQIQYRELMKPPGIDESPMEQADASEEFHPDETQVAPAEVDPLVDQLGLTVAAKEVKEEAKQESAPNELPFGDANEMTEAEKAEYLAQETASN